MSDPLVHFYEENGIYVCVFYKNSRQAVDDYSQAAWKMLQAQAAEYGAPRSNCFLIDVTQSGMFSVTYAAQRMTTLFKNAAFTMPEQYVAYVTSNLADDMIVRMMNGLTLRNMQHTRRVFHDKQRDEAFEWLRTHLPDANA